MEGDRRDLKIKYQLINTEWMMELAIHGCQKLVSERLMRNKKCIVSKYLPTGYQ